VAHTNIIFSPVVTSFYEKYRGRETGVRKIYISRSQASFRRVKNESELTVILLSMGFECLNLESLDFESQVKIFQNTHIVVAPHGAGLANIVFMPLGSTVIELIGSSFDAGMTSYSAVAEAFQLNYSLIIGESVDLENTIPANLDFEIPIDDLITALEMGV
jgi:capsular polysaccharide biosynthesis protein